MHFRCNFTMLFSLCALMQLSFSIGASVPAWTTLQTSSTTYLARVHSTESNNNVLALHSVPYAQSPTGKLRFQDPRPLAETPNFVDARSLPSACMQMPHMKSAESQILRMQQDDSFSEDCLYLSIYVPLAQMSSNQSAILTTEQILSSNTLRPLPAIVWFPGEGYDFADARQFDGVALASQTNSIVVSVQYRVGAFGFLRIPGLVEGNQAMKDQIAALQWLQANLRSFGGNPEAVTVAGRFTGSMSLSILLTSPQLQQRSLFNRAVLMSGIAAGDWVFDSQPSNRQVALAQQLGCSVTNSSEQLKCLQQTPAAQILAQSGFGWKPVLDGKLIVDTPINMLKNGFKLANVTDVLIGSNEHDGSLCYKTQQAIHSLNANAINSGRLGRDSYLQLVQQDLEMFFDGQKSAVSHIYKSLANAKHSDNNYSKRYIQFCTQLLIRSHQEQFAQLLRDQTQVFSYKLTAKPSISSSPASLSNAGFGDDVLLAFGRWTLASDRKLAASFQSMLGAFVYQGAAGLRQVSSTIESKQIELVENAKGSIISETLEDQEKTLSLSLNSLPSQTESASSDHFDINCQLSSATDSVNNAARPAHSLLTRLFAHATQRSATSHVACAHLNSKTDFLRLVDPSAMPTLLPLQSS